MASLFGGGGGGGAVTDFPRGDVMRSRITAGTQFDDLSGLGGYGGYNPLEIVKSLRADKERQRREQMEWDARFAAQQQRKATQLGAAQRQPESYESFLNRRRTAARNEMLTQPFTMGTAQSRISAPGLEMANARAAAERAEEMAPQEYQAYLAGFRGSVPGGRGIG